MKQQEKKSANHMVWIDLVRVIACFFVIVNHTNSQIFVNTTPSVEWFISLTYFFVSKIAVPLFVIISGYLLLDRQDSYYNNFCRIMRMATVLFFASLGYYLYFVSLGRIYSSFSWVEFLGIIVKGPMTGAFWYLYLYIGLLIMLPFLQKLVKGMERKDFHVFFAISAVVYGIWPILEHYVPVIELSENLELPLFASYVAMLMLGYYFKKYAVSRKNTKIGSAVIFVVAIAFNVIATYMEYTYVSQDSNKYLFLDERTFFPIVLAACCVFYIFKDMKLHGFVGRIISLAGSCAFGIYLLSDFLIGYFQFVFDFFSRYMSPILAVLIMEGWIFVLGFVVIYFVKKIPIIKELV